MKRFVLFLMCVVLLGSINCMAISYDDNSQLEGYYSHKQNVDTSLSSDSAPSINSIAKPDDLNLDFFSATWEMICVTFKWVTGSSDV